MKWIVRIVGVLVVLIAIVAVAGYTQPRVVELTRSTVIDAPADQIYPHLVSLEATRAWSPWMGLDPDMQVTLSGPDSGVGNTMAWVSEVDNVGTGSQTITAVSENERVETALDFGDMGTAEAQFALASDGAGTRVDWSFQTDMGNNPVGRWFGAMIKNQVGADYDTGLANLKALVEGS